MQAKQKIRMVDPEVIESINKDWGDNEMTHAMWEIASTNDMKRLGEYVRETPEVVHMRSNDGRGIMWWAHEYGQTKMIKILKKLGVSENLKDEKGMTPLDLSK